MVDLDNCAEQIYKYRCNCGNIFLGTKSEEKAGLFNSCGRCGHTNKNDYVPPLLTIDENGEKVVLVSCVCDECAAEMNDTICVVRCDCGNECIVTALELQTGMAKSCGRCGHPNPDNYLPPLKKKKRRRRE